MVGGKSDLGIHMVYIKDVQLISKLQHYGYVTGCSTTAQPPVLSPSYILPPPSSPCSFIPTRKISTPLSNMLLFRCFNRVFLKLRQCAIANFQLRRTGSICYLLMCGKILWCYLTFRHRASCIQDRGFAILQRTLFIYLIIKYISLSDICLTVHHLYK